MTTTHDGLTIRPVPTHTTNPDRLRDAADRIATQALANAHALDDLAHLIRDPDLTAAATRLRHAARDITHALNPPPAPTPPHPTRRRRHWTLAALAPLVALAVLAVALLTGCTLGYVRPGDPCDTIGDTARSKTGYAMVCKAPTPSDPTDTPRWRRA